LTIGRLQSKPEGFKDGPEKTGTTGEAKIEIENSNGEHRRARRTIITVV
jgi:hypothetical protein